MSGSSGNAKKCGCSGGRWCALCAPPNDGAEAAKTTNRNETQEEVEKAVADDASNDNLSKETIGQASATLTSKLKQQEDDDDDDVSAAGQCLADCVVGQFRPANPVSGCSFAQIGGAFTTTATAAAGAAHHRAARSSLVYHACPECNGLFPSRSSAPFTGSSPSSSSSSSSLPATTATAIVRSCADHHNKSDDDHDDPSSSNEKGVDEDEEEAITSLVSALLDGFVVERDFVTVDEERALLHELDAPPPTATTATASAVITNDDDGVETTSAATRWKLSQSGRRKQDWGPQPNFKKRKLKLRAEYKGLEPCVQSLVRSVEKKVTSHCSSSSSSPSFHCAHWERYLQYRKTNNSEHNHLFHPPEKYNVVEASSLEYVQGRSTNLDPHIDDTWVWGPRIAGVSLAGDCVMTLCTAVPLSLLRRAEEVVALKKKKKKGGEQHDKKEGNNRSALIRLLLSDVGESSSYDEYLQRHYLPLGKTSTTQQQEGEEAKDSEGAPASHQQQLFVPIVLHRYIPQRSFFVFHKHSRYSLLHGIAHYHVLSPRRVSITMREFSETILRSAAADGDSSTNNAGGMARVVSESFVLAGHKTKDAAKGGKNDGFVEGKHLQ